MKKIIALLLAVVMVLGLVACGSTPNTDPTTGATEGNNGGETAEVTEVTLKVWAPQEDQVDENSWLIQVEKQFEAAHPEYKITWDNGVCAEGDAKTLLTARGSFRNDTLPGYPDYRGGVSYYILDKSDIAELVNESYNPYKVTIDPSDLNIAG